MAWIAPRAFPADVGDPATVHAALARGVQGHNMAKAAIEMGCWGLAASRQGVSLADLLGGARRGTRDAIVTGISLGIQTTPDALVERALAARAAGFRKIKLKISPGADVAYVAAVREALGPDASLMADANSAYTPADADHLRQLDRYALLMIEQPLGRDDLVRHAALQRLLATPLCLDESTTEVDRAEDMIALGAGRVINIKPGRVGGFVQAVAIDDLAERHGVPVWCGGMLESGIGRAYNVALASLPDFSLPSDLSASAVPGAGRGHAGVNGGRRRPGARAARRAGHRRGRRHGMHRLPHGPAQGAPAARARGRRVTAEGPEPAAVCEPFPAPVRDALLALRRDLHRHPELAFREERTAERLTRALESLPPGSVASLARVVGTGVVARRPRRGVQLGMGIALVVAAALTVAQARGLIPGGGTLLELDGPRLVAGLAGNFVLGALMTIGIGLYGPCMILVALLGMDPKAAFPIMMGFCAFLMPIAGARFVRERARSTSATRSDSSLAASRRCSLRRFSSSRCRSRQCAGSS